ncbi:predicted protein [Sclerotinia sclerotiorum 1980 UF-70]|uniref:Uncharacterized protein n=1 Tax=Sclerotinia sclerotiorum (strain ATCC 18683 / 1980 / Ss-1) TaxID=665079 RepID=A7EN00_SCLS1|nr:predicted protein [Sclerotinia sclerotiorum 1980 UF-70]EDO04216.1 predicted protein [Sclerotinia sclerotiorum 1980 UF-70]
MGTRGREIRRFLWVWRRWWVAMEEVKKRCRRRKEQNAGTGYASTLPTEGRGVIFTFRCRTASAYSLFWMRFQLNMQLP